MESNEYQQLEKFNGIFSLFQQLGQIQPSMQLQEAIGHLQKIAADTTFHAQGGSEAPIQVIGMLEAAGLRFDHLWIIGLSDDVWPEPASPNPLLPISLQRKQGLPHASPQRELEYASAITQRLLSGAEDVVVSYAKTDGKNLLRASPLITQLPSTSIDELDISQLGDIRRLGFDSVEIEKTVDNTGPEIPPGTHLTGGSGLLNDQSACPFRAFANHRLGAVGLEEPVSGVDARMKGIITHRVLQLLWQQIGDQERLLSMNAMELKQLIEKTVSQELSVQKKNRPETFTPRLLEIEQDRLTELIMQWLELEKQRAYFKVDSLEQRQRISLSGLELDVRADRVDLLEDGTKLIVDYKTGKSISYKSWFDRRIGEPQLPLYCTINSEDISGVCLAGVNRAKLGFKGITEQSEVVPGVKEFSKNRESTDYSDWNGMKQAWIERLELLADEVRSGRADVMPKEPKVCDYCPLPSLCRIHEWGED
jgi:probable DNA repair protein